MNNSTATIADNPNRKRCEHCGQSFIGTRSDAVYCSSACRQSAYRERHPESTYTPGTPALPQHKFETITPELAEAYLGKNTDNRNVRKGNVSKLARDIKNGNYLITGDSIRFDWNGVLVDGQHRLLAIIASGQPVVTLVVRNLNPRVRDVIDAGAKRSAADALGFNEVSANATTIAAAIRLIIGFQRGVVVTTASRVPDLTNSEIVDWYVEDGGQIEEYANLSRSWYRKLHCRPGVLTAAIHMLASIDAEQAMRFFNDMINLTLDGPSDPRRVLLTRLDRGEKVDARMPEAEQLFYLIRTWNAWRSGGKDSPKLLKAANAAGPFRVPEPK